MRQWFFIHTYSGHENKVLESLNARIRDMELSEQITEVLLPKETVVEMRGNKRIESSRMFYPGYVLVEIECDERGKIPDNVFHAIKSTPKVTGFLGTQNKPQPVSDREVERILGRVAEVGAAKPRNLIHYETGERVRVSDGPFQSLDCSLSTGSGPSIRRYRSRRGGSGRARSTGTAP